jgi:hypothetical protein
MTGTTLGHPGETQVCVSSLSWREVRNSVAMKLLTTRPLLAASYGR